MVAAITTRNLLRFRRFFLIVLLWKKYISWEGIYFIYKSFAIIMMQNAIYVNKPVRSVVVREIILIGGSLTLFFFLQSL
jgi:hypothetical protein